MEKALEPFYTEREVKNIIDFGCWVKKKQSEVSISSSNLSVTYIPWQMLYSCSYFGWRIQRTFTYSRSATDRNPISVMIQKSHGRKEYTVYQTAKECIYFIRWKEGIVRVFDGDKSIGYIDASSRRGCSVFADRLICRMSIQRRFPYYYGGVCSYVFPTTDGNEGVMTRENLKSSMTQCNSEYRTLLFSAILWFHVERTTINNQPLFNDPTQW